MSTETEIYLSGDRYDRLVEALLNVEPCPVTGTVTADQIKMALGMAGDIWPMEIRGDMIADALEHAERQSRCAAQMFPIFSSRNPIFPGVGG